MNFNDTKNYMRSRLREYVESVTELDPRTGNVFYKCPLCGSGWHDSKDSDGAFSIGKGGTHWECFSTNHVTEPKSGDIFDLIGAVQHTDDKGEQFQAALDFFGLPVPEDGNVWKWKKEDDYALGWDDEIQGGTEERQMQHQNTQQPAPAQAEQPAAAAQQQSAQQMQQPADDGREERGSFIREAHEHRHGGRHLLDRGLTYEIIDRFRLGTVEDPHYGECIVIPYQTEDNYYILRKVNPTSHGDRYKKIRGVSEPLFNPAALENADGDPVFVCEGQFDAISIEQAGGHAVAVGGGGTRNLLDALAEHRPSAPLILCYDLDDAGQQGQAALAAKLDQMGIRHLRARFSAAYSEGVKDPNGMLVDKGEQFYRDTRANIKRVWGMRRFTTYEVDRYLSDGSYENDIGYFKQYSNRKTGFKNIDRHLTLYPGLAALGGSASLGKSTFAVNMADNLAAAGETILYFAFEQEPIEIVTKSLARRVWISNPKSRMTNIAIKNGWTNDPQQAEILEQIKINYRNTNARRFRIVRCGFDTTAADLAGYIEKFIDASGVKPVVFIDYLQLIAPPEGARGDQRTLTDMTLKQLKQVQVNNELLVVMISSFNRSSYDATVNYDSFKETGMIEYTCDYIWGLQLSILEDDTFYTKEGAKGGEKETGLKAKRNAVYKANSGNPDINGRPKEVEFVSLKSRNGKQNYKCFFQYYMEFDAFEEDMDSPHAHRPKGEGDGGTVTV